ncbi:hypothetical protein EVAR_77606_1 [Eumeta japonica]|uniref:Uncharacterized protein n=1 Tax=Eumeta variegata TaxID=151549 RepID=A0A4C1T9V9_EUMVA|nr:hypothetical protein EVAR_77606_1 [Eumeta japonica]
MSQLFAFGWHREKDLKVAHPQIVYFTENSRNLNLLQGGCISTPYLQLSPSGYETPTLTPSYSRSNNSNGMLQKRRYSFLIVSRLRLPVFMGGVLCIFIVHMNLTRGESAIMAHTHGPGPLGKLPTQRASAEDPGAEPFGMKRKDYGTEVP